MKKKGSTRSARTKAKNNHISQGGRDLSAQAGLIPVVKFFHKEGIVSKTEQNVDHQRGAPGLYDEVDMVIVSMRHVSGSADVASSAKGGEIDARGPRASRSGFPLAWRTPGMQMATSLTRTTAWTSPRANW